MALSTTLPGLIADLEALRTTVDTKRAARGRLGTYSPLQSAGADLVVEIQRICELPIGQPVQVSGKAAAAQSFTDAMAEFAARYGA